MASIYHEHADIYDLAFDWDVAADVGWMHSRLGADCRSVLEPGCGSGRIVEALARRGLEAVGIDLSPQMIELARKRLREITNAEVVLGDITDFNLARVFDGAVCPINTLLHLSPSDLAKHLAVMADHLRPGARYLIQLALYDPADRSTMPKASRWEITRADTTLKIVWATEEVDAADGRLRQRSQIEVLSGPRAGEVLEEMHEMTAWTPERWQGAVERSPFEITAIYNGGQDGCPVVAQGATGLMLWHELSRL